jgi:transcriptional regulator GlxA family with amidase domain
MLPRVLPCTLTSIDYGFDRVGYRAARLLQEGDSSIKQVAEQCGFANGSQFILAFRRVEGMTPGEFRARA